MLGSVGGEASSVSMVELHGHDGGNAGHRQAKSKGPSCLPIPILLSYLKYSAPGAVMPTWIVAIESSVHGRGVGGHRLGVGSSV